MVDRKVKSVQDKISKKERKEYNYLRSAMKGKLLKEKAMVENINKNKFSEFENSTTKQLIMNAKNKDAKTTGSK